VVAGSVYLGVPAEAGRIASAGRLPVGGLGYQAAGLRALLAWQRATFTVDTGDAAARFPGFCVVVANSAYLAGGTCAAPGADVTDGLLDVVTVREGSKVSFVTAMLLATRGEHLRLSGVATVRAAGVTVSADRAMLAGADGETLLSAYPLAPGTPLGNKNLQGALRAVVGDAQPSPAGRAWPPRNDSTNSGLTDSSDGVPSIRTSPPPST
jgi:diacylglycerol kinase family enzyme